MTSGVSPRVLSAASTAAISISEYSPATKRWKAALLSSRESDRRLRASSTSLTRIGRVLRPADHVLDDGAPVGREDRLGMELHAQLRGAPVRDGHDHAIGAGEAHQAVGEPGRRERMVAAHGKPRRHPLEERPALVANAGD